MSHRSYYLLTLFLVAAFGCAKTHQARRVETSGFLRDYSKFREGEEDEALLIYRNPNADFTKYDKVLVERVTVWRPVDSDLSEVPEEDFRRLASYRHTAMVKSLRDDYEIVKTPGPGVLRLRVAIVEAAESWVVLDTFSTVIPQFHLISAGRRLATGTHAFVGAAGVEGEIVDAVTGERLLAGVDRRVGSKVIRGMIDSWDDVMTAYDYWAQRIRDRLREERPATTAPSGGDSG